MKLKVFTVYDSKAEAYKAPFYMHSKGEAIRGFTDTVNSPDHVFAKYPADFTLFELGEYDDQTGKFHCYSTPVSLGVGIEFVKPVHGIEKVTDLRKQFEAGKREIG